MLGVLAELEPQLETLGFLFVFPRTISFSLTLKVFFYLLFFVLGKTVVKTCFFGIDRDVKH